ncbi:hypothetical protein AB0J52_25425, partial [Spirillospora sp. NPDC049652]
MARRSTVLLSAIAAAAIAPAVVLSGPAQAAQPVPALEKGRFYCENVQLQAHHLFASRCVPLSHGRLFQFEVFNRASQRHAFHCARGWGEGQVIRGEDCYALHR